MALERSSFCLWLSAGSSFWTPALLYRHSHIVWTQTYSKAFTLCPAQPTLCYLLLVSFVCTDQLETLLTDVLLETQERAQSKNYKCTSRHTDVPFEPKGLLNHKTNSWCES